MRIPNTGFFYSAKELREKGKERYTEREEQERYTHRESEREEGKH
jgi:hypothetical protein